MVLFVASNKLTTATHAIFLQDSSILYVLLLAPWLLREKLRRHDAWVMLLVVLGLVLCFSAQQSAGRTAPDPSLGNLLAACSGVTWAFTVIGMRWLAARDAAHPSGVGSSDAALPAVICGNVIACLVSLSPALPFHAIRPLDWGLILFLGSVQIALAYIFVARGLSGVSALEASVILLIEPVVNPILTWLVHAEAPHPRVIFGGVLILSATVAQGYWEPRARRRAGDSRPS
jgi:drug/metabolite transporter (DMT)-like permease